MKKCGGDFVLVDTFSNGYGSSDEDDEDDDDDDSDDQDFVEKFTDYYKTKQDLRKNKTGQFVQAIREVSKN